MQFPSIFLWAVLSLSMERIEQTLHAALTLIDLFIDWPPALVADCHSQHRGPLGKQLRDSIPEISHNDDDDDDNSKWLS